MNPVESFNALLTARRACERSEYGSYGIPQFRESAQAVLAYPELAARAEAVGAAAMLTYAWQALNEQDADDQAGGRRHVPSYEAIAAPLDRLFEPGQVRDDAALEARLRTFATDAAAGVAALYAAPPGQPDDAAVGIVTSSGGVHVASQLGDPRWPQVSLLDAQVDKAAPLVKAIGRQTDGQGWVDWFKEQLVTVKDNLPGVIEWGVWRNAKQAINAFLGVGLLPIAGHNIITFGANVLAPWKALRSFPAMMAQQAVLHDLRAYAKERMHLPADNPVVAVLTAAIDGIDWAAVRTAFTVTPAGILISVYTTARAVAKYTVPQQLTAYGWAQTLIDRADANLTTPTAENRLAAMTVMHLAGDRGAYVELMTERLEDAYKGLTKLLVK